MIHFQTTVLEHVTLFKYTFIFVLDLVYTTLTDRKNKTRKQS